MSGQCLLTVCYTGTINGQTKTINKCLLTVCTTGPTLIKHCITAYVYVSHIHVACILIRDTLKQVLKFRELQVSNFQVPGTSSSEIKVNKKIFFQSDYFGISELEVPGT